MEGLPGRRDGLRDAQGKCRIIPATRRERQSLFWEIWNARIKWELCQSDGAG